MKRLLIAALERLPASKKETLIQHLVGNLSDTLEPDKAIRFHMRLDNWLYPLQGRASVCYGGGVHTKHRHTRYHDFFVERVSGAGHVLEVGCGNGTLAFDIAERGKVRLTAIDMNEKKIAVAKATFSHPDIDYRVGNVLEDLPDDSFEVVVMSIVLEHLPDRAIFLLRLKDTTGFSKILIRVPLFERDWRVPLKQELGLDWRGDPTHETEYTLESFAGEMADAKLKVIHQEVRWGEFWAEAVPVD